MKFPNVDAGGFRSAWEHYYLYSAHSSSKLRCIDGDQRNSATSTMDVQGAAMLKTTIWIVTVLGVLPVTLLAIAHLAATVAHTFIRVPNEVTEPGTYSVVGDVTVQIGPSRPLHLSTHAWPAIVLLFGVAVVVVGLWTLLPAQPKHFPNGGFSRVQGYVEALFQSRAKYASLIISTADGQHSILLSRQNGQCELSLSVDRTKNDGQEVRTAEYFKQLGLPPTNEYLSRNGGIEDAGHCFEYALGNDPKSIARFCVAVFTDLFQVDDKGGLEFRDDMGS